MKSERALGCPFCNFTDHDHYFLLQHVETIHPEGGRPSPFAVQEKIGEGARYFAEEMECTRKSPADYIECQCGESCLLAKFESHLEMHYAEGISFDEWRSNSAGALMPNSRILYHGRFSSITENPRPPTLKGIFSGPSKPIPTMVKHPHRGTSRKSGNAVRDLIGVLRRPSSPPSHRPSQTSGTRAPRRLGVRTASGVGRRFLLKYATESRVRSPRARKTNA